jgi:RecJ-like exonuclease
MKPGACHDCAGSGKCTFCKGTGVRKTTTNGFASEKINSVTYEEKCPYCSGTGVCKYCDGKGKCRHCKGDGKIENWNFFEEYSAGIKSESAQATERNTDK